MIADQLRPQPYVRRIEHPLDRHRHEARVPDVAVAVGVDEPARLREQKPGLRIGRVPGGDIGAIENGEHLQQRNTARGGRWHAHRVATIGPAQGLGHLGAIGAQVLVGHRARERRLVRGVHELFGDLSLVKGARSIARDGFEGVRVLRILEQVALLDDVAIGAREKVAHLVGRRKWRALAQKHREPLGHLEALRGAADGGLKQLQPVHGAELVVRAPQHGHDARHPGRAAAADGLDIREGLAVLVEEHVGVSARRGLLTAIERRHLAGVRIVVHEERAAGDTGALRLDQPEHRLHGDRGIDRLAALLENLDARIDRQRIGSRHPRLESAVPVTTKPRGGR